MATQPKAGLVKSIQRKAINFLGGQYDMDQTASDLGIHLAVAYGLASQRLGLLKAELEKSGFADTSNQFVTTTAAPWLDTGRGLAGEQAQAKVKAFHENYESYDRTCEVLKTMQVQIKDLEAKKTKSATDSTVEFTEAEQYRLEYLTMYEDRVEANKTRKALAMVTDSQHLLGFSFKPLEDRPIITKVPVILTKGDTILQNPDGMTKNTLGVKTT